MPVKAYINDELALRVHIMHDAIRVGDFREMARFYAENLHYTERDLINIIDDTADFSAITRAELTVLADVFAALQRGLRTALIRRSLWVCANVHAWRLLEIWLKDRHSHDGRATDVYLVATLDDGECAYDRAEIDAVKQWRGFQQFATFAAAD